MDDYFAQYLFAPNKFVNDYFAKLPLPFDYDNSLFMRNPFIEFHIVQQEIYVVQEEFYQDSKIYQIPIEYDYKTKEDNEYEIILKKDDNPISLEPMKPTLKEIVCNNGPQQKVVAPDVTNIKPIWLRSGTETSSIVSDKKKKKKKPKKKVEPVKGICVLCPNKTDNDMYRYCNNCHALHKKCEICGAHTYNIKYSLCNKCYAENKRCEICFAPTYNMKYSICNPCYAKQKKCEKCSGLNFSSNTKYCKKCLKNKINNFN
jgi:hypothetical protein